MNLFLVPGVVSIALWSCLPNFITANPQMLSAIDDVSYRSQEANPSSMNDGTTSTEVDDSDFLYKGNDDPNIASLSRQEEAEDFYKLESNEENLPQEDPLPSENVENIDGDSNPDDQKISMEEDDVKRKKRAASFKNPSNKFPSPGLDKDHNKLLSAFTRAQSNLPIGFKGRVNKFSSGSAEIQYKLPQGFSGSHLKLLHGLGTSYAILPPGFDDSLLKLPPRFASSFTKLPPGVGGQYDTLFSRSARLQYKQENSIPGLDRNYNKLSTGFGSSLTKLSPASGGLQYKLPPGYVPGNLLMASSGRVPGSLHYPVKLPPGFNKKPSTIMQGKTVRGRHTWTTPEEMGTWKRPGAYYRATAIAQALAHGGKNGHSVVYNDRRKNHASKSQNKPGGLPAAAAAFTKERVKLKDDRVNDGYPTALLPVG